MEERRCDRGTISTRIYDAASNVTRTTVSENGVTLSDATGLFDEGSFNYESRQRTNQATSSQCQATSIGDTTRRTKTLSVGVNGEGATSCNRVHQRECAASYDGRCLARITSTQAVVPIGNLKTSEPSDEYSFAALAQEAQQFLRGHAWCKGIRRGFLDIGWEGILGVFYFEIEPVHNGIDDSVWVIVGDIPPAYFSSDTPNGPSALDAYTREMQRWVDATKRGAKVVELLPVNVPPTEEYASRLAGRLDFIRDRLLCEHKDEIVKNPRVTGERRFAAKDGKMIDASEAAKRLLCLGSIIMRSEIEAAVSDQTSESSDSEQMGREAREEQEALATWLNREGLRDALSPSEQHLLTAALGTWTAAERRDASWRCESAGVLAWALSLLDRMLPYDVQVDPMVLSDVIPLFARVQGVLESSALRASAEIWNAREHAKLWLWRARTAKEQPKVATSSHNQEDDANSSIHLAVRYAERKGWFTGINGDFPAFGEPFTKLSAPRASEVRSIARERLYCLNWLCGCVREWE